MKDIIYVIFDITVYFVQGLLLVTLLKTAQTRFPFTRKYMSEVILLLQYVAVQLVLHYSSMVKNILYGNHMTIQNSRQSILPVLISMLITVAISLLLFNEKKLKIVYYVVTFYSVIELVKFAFYSIFLWLLEKLMNCNLYLCVDKQIYGEKMFYRAGSVIEILWNILFSFAILFLSYRIFKWIKKYLDMKEAYQKSEFIFLLFPSVIGLLLCLMIRSILVFIEGMDIHLLLDSRPEMNFLIPCISLLCIIMVILAAKMLRKLIDESNQKIEVSVYQDRIKEMEQHIGDIENLYDGIRGMKHDMKNYIADMDALMNQQSEHRSDQAALKQYLTSLRASVDQLDMKYNTGNPVTDAIIQRYVQLTQKNDIDFQADFIFPSNMNIDAFDLSIIINNALDNALEACKRQKEGKRTIELNAYQRENMFFIIIKNSFDGTLTRNKIDGRLMTTKTDSKNHGLGLRNIQVCAEKYYGKAETTVKEKEFELAVMLQKRMLS